MDLFGQERQGSAFLSACGLYRYSLRRIIDPAISKTCAFIMLNPSTADEVKNDPTIERCERRARSMGFGGLRVVNLFAFRATNPKVMLAHSDPIGPENDHYIDDACRDAGMIVAAWGNHGTALQRGPRIMLMAMEKGYTLHALRVSKTGQPYHPLYVPYDVQPRRWAGGAA